MTDMLRRPDYLSPSALQTWEKDRREYYMRYLSHKVPRPPQTVQMALGSAFDGLVKNEIERRYGLPVRDYTSQVEEHQRDAVAAAAQRLLQWYLPYLNRLLIVGEPHCETDLSYQLEYRTQSSSGVASTACLPIRGKPDLWWGTTMHDWKVNGFYSQASPAPGYRWDSKTGCGHKSVVPGVVPTVDTLTLWADQLTTYSWMVPGITHAMVHQLTYRGAARLTEYYAEVTRSASEALRERYVHMWESLQQGRVFTDLTPEADTAAQAQLDILCSGLVKQTNLTPEQAAKESWFTGATR